MFRIRKKDKQALVAIILTMIIAVFLQTSVSGKSFKNDRLVVWFFDIGQGDAIFIDAPDRQVLIDGGPTNQVIEKLTSVMPFWDRSIDIIINTHPHADHVTGLNYVIDRYAVYQVYGNGIDYGTEVYKEFQKDVDGVLSAGDAIDLGNGATLEIFWPEPNIENQYLKDPNDGSIVALLNYGDSSILLTGDIGVDEEVEIMDDLSKIDVLKVPHQGSLTSSGPVFLSVVDPEIAIITVGENDYGHPSPIVVDRYKKIGAQILRTDLNGDIRVVTDGGEPEIKLFDL